MQALHSTFSSLRDKWAPVTHVSTFRHTGQLTPEEFLLAGDYLVYKFPSWSWAPAASPARQVAYLPPGQQYLVTRGVPCHRRVDDDFAGDAGRDESTVQDGFASAGSGGGGGGGTGAVAGGEDDGWLRTGGLGASQVARAREVRTLGKGGDVDVDENEEEEEEVPDMEDEDDDEEAIIRDPKSQGASAPLRTYNLYITYTPYYRTPRLFLSGYTASSQPLDPRLMMEDIVGDYKDKTVTLEDFPFFASPVKMASVHPCKHASVMKTLLDRADAALKIRREKQRRARAVAAAGAGVGGAEDLADGMARTTLGSHDERTSAESAKAGGNGSGNGNGNGNGNEEWEVLHHEGEAASSSSTTADDEVAIRVDQYLVVFLKFLSSLMPSIEHDFTMEV